MTNGESCDLERDMIPGDMPCNNAKADTEQFVGGYNQSPYGSTRPQVKYRTGLKGTFWHWSLAAR